MTDNLYKNTCNTRKGRVCAILLAAVLSCALGGCGEEKPEPPKRPVHGQSTVTLPAVEEYKREAERLRAEQARQTETDALPKETEISLSEEILEGESLESGAETDEPENEEWKEGLSFPSATIAPLESEAGESAVSAADEGSFEDVTERVTAAEDTETSSAAAARETAAQTSTGAGTISVSPAAAENATLGLSGEVSSEYDKEFFSSDLFIGDSISTGYSLYGFMDEKNVFAKIGLNPSSVLTKSVSTVYGEMTAADMIGTVQPKRVYIMLGSNGIQWLSAESMLKSMKSLTEMISLSSPQTEIVIVGVPPVTAGYDSTVEGMDVMAAVNGYNSGLAEFAEENGCIFVDPGAILKDSTGYFALEYAEKDGMHFKSSTYKILLSFIQREVTAAEERAAAMAAAEEEAAMAAAGNPETVQTENSEDGAAESGENTDGVNMENLAEEIDNSVKNAVTGFPEEFVTLPEVMSAKAEKNAEQTTQTAGE